MANAFSNRGLVLQVTGENVGTWGTALNNLDITLTDQILGTTLAYTLSSGTSALTQAQSQNLAFALSGAITTNIIVTLPLNYNSATVAIGGNFIFSNQTTGNFTVTVKTVATGSTGVTVPRGLRAMLYSDGTHVWYANDGGKAIGSSVIGYSGDPNGAVTCTPATAFTPADMLWDYTNNVLYVCTAAPNTWTQSIPSSVTTIPPAASGILTLSSDATNPILTNDAVAATSVYYTPYIGNVIGIPNGSTFTSYTFSQLTLALSATYQAASGIYDVFGFLNSGVAAVGLGPIWTTGGGSVTPGSCARGTGAGSTQLNRLLGTRVNAVAVTLNNGPTTYSVGVQSAIYLGSVSIDSTTGQVTCQRTWGQSRKWGVWNAYNRQPIYLKAGDSTASWDYSTNTIRPSNGSANNSLSIFTGLAEEPMNVAFAQRCDIGVASSTNGQSIIGIGINSTSTFSGSDADLFVAGGNGAQVYWRGIQNASYLSAPSLGLNTVTSLEQVPISTYLNTFYGTEANMVLSAKWQG